MEGLGEQLRDKRHLARQQGLSLVAARIRSGDLKDGELAYLCGEAKALWEGQTDWESLQSGFLLSGLLVPLRPLEEWIVELQHVCHTDRKSVV